MRDLVEFFEALRKQEGQELGVTEWFTIDQVKNDLFGLLSRNHQRNYSDPAWAESNTRHRTTLINPFFLLALHAANSLEMGVPIRTTEQVTAFNYGYDSVVWNAPVPVNSLVRARVIVRSVNEPRPGHYLAKLYIEYETEGAEQPAIAAETAIYFLPPHEVESIKSK